uniref:RNA-directed DNA polymerase, eukaryota, reverse transcriptase zinc-binding domain protein n=1 Tax=Tanacetum cinerariifolium TaxID=118510 RepID=A0A6L2LGH2_TANCI|nr:hypothetical protein [Tanacetum cinerariifolium]
MNMLEIRINILEARLELERHPEDHTFQSGAILYELLDDMKNLRMDDLKTAKIVIYDSPCMLAGDFNVTLRVVAHTAGGSIMTNDMQDLVDCVSKIEAEDICSSEICNEEGTGFEENMVAEQFLKHFNNFLGVVDNVIPIVDVDSLFSSKLEDNKALDMVREETDTEIKNVVFDIGDVKAPEPDGYSSNFFKNSWKIVGKDVCNVV